MGDRDHPICGYLAPISRLVDEFSQVRIPLRRRPTDGAMALPNMPKPNVRILVIIAALLAIVLILRQMIIRPQPAPSRTASAILADDEAAAGAMWAKKHQTDDPGECPAYSAAFRKGCGDYVRGAGR